jgi:hypothetical protein
MRAVLHWHKMQPKPFGTVEAELEFPVVEVV